MESIRSGVREADRALMIFCVDCSSTYTFTDEGGGGTDTDKQTNTHTYTHMQSWSLGLSLRNDLLSSSAAAG